MNISLLLIGAVIFFYAGYRIYSTYLARVWGEDDKRTTPAVALKDDVDYAPAKKGIVFSHYFASIAGAGPIIGTTVALIYGYAPVWLWVVLGGIFIGAVHDYSALFISLQEKGKSIAQISSSSMGRVGYILFITFTFTMMVW
jgi:carbon starvation protein